MQTKIPTIKNTFSKQELKQAEKLANILQTKLSELDEVCKAIGNNTYLVKNGITMNASFNSTPLANGKTKVSIKVLAIVPAKIQK